ncbi:MAG TPA: hypothetical protein VD908_00195 [Cytophagales bacterium]|nr:hypothetical protein [Cytophagales bacterium]
MITITTRRHPIKFYAVLTFGFLFLCALGTILLFVSIDILQKGQPAIKEYFMPVFCFAVYFLAFSMVYVYWKNSPKIIIDKYTIKVGERTFYLKDIKDIILTGKMTFPYIIKFPMEGTAILFNDGSKKILFDDMYSNSWQIKSFLEQVVINKQEYKPRLTTKVEGNAIQFETEDTFKGNQFTSLRGISLWGLVGFFAFILFSKWKSPPIGLLILFGAIGTFWFVLHSWLMHYFELTKDYLIVRNHNFIWVTKIYPLSDIKEVVYETQGKQPNSMRVITKDFKNKLYPAGTLRDKTWLDLKDKLETKGVAVRNECIF